MSLCSVHIVRTVILMCNVNPSIIMKYIYKKNEAFLFAGQSILIALRGTLKTVDYILNILFSISICIKILLYSY